MGTDILAEYQEETGSGFSRGRNPGQVREYYYGNGLLLAQKLYLPEGIGDLRHRLSWTHATLDLICYSQDALGSVTLITGQGGKVLGKYRYDAFGNAYNGRFEGCVFGEDEFDNFWDWDEDQSVAANSATTSGDKFTAQGWNGPGNGYGWGHYKHGRSWGILRQGNVYGFTGQRFEPELGVYSFTFRDYSPRTMRWMTEDPIKDGVNWYLYCGGDPVNWVDPLGLYVPLAANEEQEEAIKTLGYIGAYQAKGIAEERLKAAAEYAIEHGMDSALDNEADAYRHFTWNVENTQKFGKDKAEKIGDNHEKFGEDDFGGSLGSRMDLWNNSLGRQMGDQFKGDSCDEIWDLAQDMDLPVMNPDDPRLNNWDYNKEAPIPKPQQEVLDEAKRSGWDAGTTKAFYDNLNRGGCKKVNI